VCIALVLALVLALGSGSVTMLRPAAAKSATRDSFAALEASMRDRVRDDALRGGALLVVRAGTVLHESSFRDVASTTVMPVASASKWLTSATLMTLVDEGRLSLDDRVEKVLPAFGGNKRGVRVRHLLAHTSGLAYHSCVGDPFTTTEACSARIASGPAPSARPGTRFEYSSVGYEVAARIVEVLTGESFEAAFEHRIAGPLGMIATRFDTLDGRTVAHPMPAASAVSTVDDYARFLAMLSDDGVAGSRRVLTTGSVEEIERNQVAGIDTRDDDAVETTGIRTYGLGVWRDVVGRDGRARVVSGSGAFGFYPWIDRVHHSYGIVAVADDAHGAAHAVPASQRQARASWRAAARYVP
jgi:CubicO group peptidase (beta-lactamase class C family)